MAGHEMHLVIPATAEDVLMMRMTVSGLGLLCGLDVDLIGDLRVVTNECCDCLMGRTRVPEKLQLDAALAEGQLVLTFSAVGAQAEKGVPADRDIAYGVLSTLMPQVTLLEDGLGIWQIVCTMPAGGDATHE